MKRLEFLSLLGYAVLLPASRLIPKEKVSKDVRKGLILADVETGKQYRLTAEALEEHKTTDGKYNELTINVSRKDREEWYG